MDAYILDFLPSGKYVALSLEEAVDLLVLEMETNRSCHIEKTSLFHAEDEVETQEEE